MYRTVLSLILCISVMVSLVGCGAPAAQSDPALPASPELTTLSDGDPGDVTCLGTYYGADADAAADAVVATIGDAVLTNDLLQVYYRMAVMEHQQSGSQPAPDFTLPLDTQLVPAEEGALSWQQYFLKQALHHWHVQQSLVLASETAAFPTEEAYQPDMEKRLLFMTAMPATQYLYGWDNSYRINRLHQQWLDNMPRTLRLLAADRGFATADVMSQVLTGSKALAAYADLINRAYMFFTEMSYRYQPTGNEVTAFRQANRQLFSDPGEKLVSFRHILLIPENAQIAWDGTVTASQEDWDHCLTLAEDLTKGWQKNIQNPRYANKDHLESMESRFSEIASTYSADTASALSGGLYEYLRQGQLAPVLDQWCFDSRRQAGDYDILRSDWGYHIVYFSSSTWDWYAAAEAALLQQYCRQLIDQAGKEHPMTVDYSAIRLKQAADHPASLCSGDLLYPDIAHQRFPDTPLYLQQDYTQAKYGRFALSTHGCGVTSLAMVASYMLDEFISPAELGARYGYYCRERGSEMALCDDAPAELGIQVRGRSYDWNEITNALQRGQKVISLQFSKYWTDGGHYIVIDGTTEDNRYVVRDSNMLAYGKIRNHSIDSHSSGSLRAQGSYYWIFEPKIIHHPACVRCAEDGLVTSPEGMVQDYICNKCRTAMTRRTSFLASLTP